MHSKQPHSIGNNTFRAFATLLGKAVPLLLSLALTIAPTASYGSPQPSLFPTTPAPKVIDRILVIVNNDVITRSELDSRMKDVERRIAAQHIQAPPDNVLRKQVLNQLILEQLQLQIAKRAGIKVSQPQLDAALQTIAARNHLSLPALYKALESEGIRPARFRQQIYDQMVIQKLINREINDRVTVSQSEIANYLANEAKRNGTTEYNISHILIAIPEKATPAQIQKAKQEADSLLKQLRSGVSFEQLAIANSEGQSALKGGDLGWKQAGQLPQLFLNALRKMKPGEISGVLRSTNGFHILKLNAIRGGKQVHTIVQTHVRQILIRTNALVTPQQARMRLEQLRSRIQNGDRFSVLAKADSQDPVSAPNGGNLGWVSPGQLDPQVENVMNALKVDQISEPVRVPGGFVLIKVLGRRTKDVTNELNEANAREQIHARKAAQRYAQWVRQLRAEAYVEYFGKGLN
ncbi:MAG: peptidylprolyl isomerase [Gammaproteobacteria bacterium]|nr:peptidylprolyl isomerase [Gammaproteobacteria bacterium]